MCTCIYTYISHYLASIRKISNIHKNTNIRIQKQSHIINIYTHVCNTLKTVIAGVDIIHS